VRFPCRVRIDPTRKHSRRLNRNDSAVFAFIGKATSFPNPSRQRTTYNRDSHLRISFLVRSIRWSEKRLVCFF
jgi:hypothetical protein